MFPILQPSLQAPGAFIFTVKTNNAGTSTSTQFTMPTVISGTYNCAVNWGDGTSSTITTYNDAAWTHTYSVAGSYIVSITGTFNGIEFNNGGDCLKLLNVSQFGILQLGNTGGYFYGCANLTVTATDVLNMTGTTNMFAAFSICSSVVTIPSINSWNMSAVTSFSNMFNGCAAFNESGIGSWTTTALTNLNGTFQGCTAFNQSLNSWDVSHVTALDNCFRLCSAFNQSLNSWNTGAVTSMSQTFLSAPAFNGNITSWNVGACTNFGSFLNGCGNFNQNIGSWNMAAATNINGMFQGCSIFNQNLNSWVLTSCTIMSAVFRNCFAYNQPMNSWSTSLVTTFVNMFNGAIAFNQDVSAWTIAAVTDATSMFASSGFALTNYNKLLDSATGWPSQATIKNNVTFSAGTAHYSSGNPTTGRAVLTSTHTWTITDGGTP